MSAAQHVPVLLDRVLELLAPSVEATAAPVVVDTTLGLGGHTEALLRRFPTLHVVGIDRDSEALKRAGERLAPHEDRIELVHAVYDELADVLERLGHGPEAGGVQGVLFDLGVSSMQLDLAERGFAYAQDAPLDMRMDPTRGPSAADVLNTYSSRELARVLREYGEEKFARRIAERIVTERQVEPFTNSARLVDLLREAIPAPARRTGGHPAKRTFQALRIEVNDELAVYARALPQALEALGAGGRVVVLAYHSLEDRITKRAFARATTNDLPRDLPFAPAGHEPAFRLLTRGSEQAGGEESQDNPRARSVRLRAVERTAA
ncbi:16S rRNA (cytosine(1402)-N(4))-methyltransferase RsmH [Aeromicrobium sp. CTD01-1L150]|uniref:16S rRNA (cytosine(1402)-N(4))-methyltransferase RsmH n=1 Tax=Aeromicrobium sp. CTD01-1L150 TaxID=3341830 RepID=UPI0035C259B6